MISSSTNPNINGDVPEKPAKTRDKDKIKPSSGPNSISPGQWLTDAYIDGLESDTENEAFQSALAILESYRPGPRYRTLRHPVLAPEQSAEKMIPSMQFTVEIESLETKSLVYSTADMTAVETNDTAVGFTMLAQEGVLSGIKLHKWRTDRKAELADYQLSRKASKGKGRKKAAIRTPERECVSQSDLDAQYAAWNAAPSAANGTELWRMLYLFLSPRLSLVSREDTLLIEGRDEDFLIDFGIDFMDSLRRKQAAGELIEKFSHYVTAAWNRRRATRLTKTTKQNKRDSSSTFVLSDDGGFTGKEDRFAFTEYQVASRHNSEVSESELNARRIAKLSSLDPAIADFVGVWVTGRKQEEIGVILNKSRQSIGRLKIKAVKALQQNVQTRKVA